MPFLQKQNLELLDGLTAGTAIASKVVTTDANIDTTGQRNLTISGELDAATGDFSGAVDIAGATTVVALTASGILKTDDATDATSTTDGSLQTDGGLSVAKDAVIGDDLLLLSDASVIKFGANSEVTLTHEHDVGLILGGANPVFTIGDGGAEDTQVRFDGNALNFAIGIDDSTDKLTISKGNTLGTTVAMTIDENALVTLPDGAMEIIASGNYANLTLTTTDADANFGPELRLYRNSSSPVNDDVTGIIQFEARNNNSQDFVSSEIKSISSDVADGTEDGALGFSVMNAGTLTNSMFLTGPEVVFNELSNDVDFRVESNGNTHMLFVDGGNDRVAIGTASPQTTLHIEGTAPVIRISDSNSDSEANATGKIEFYDRNNTDVNSSIISGDGSDNNFFITNHNAKSIIFSTNNAEQMRLTAGGALSLNDTAPDGTDGSLCLNQAGGDGIILSLKSSDVSVGTDEGEADTYASFKKQSAGSGGLAITGIGSSSSLAMVLRASVDSASVNVTTSTSGYGVFATNSIKRDGSGNLGHLGANDNMCTFLNNDTTEVIFKGDGEIFSNQSATVGTFDTYEDAQLVRAYELSAGRYNKGLIDSKFDKFVQYNAKDLVDANLIGKDEDGKANSFVNITGMQRLHNGAIWQQYEKTQRLTQAMYKLATKTLGKEEADKLLDEEEIKLLN